MKKHTMIVAVAFTVALLTLVGCASNDQLSHRDMKKKDKTGMSGFYR